MKATIKMNISQFKKGDQVDVLQFLNSHIVGSVSAVCAKEDGNIVSIAIEYLNININKGENNGV